jgi:hypothetical protein
MTQNECDRIVKAATLVECDDELQAIAALLQSPEARHLDESDRKVLQTHFQSLDQQFEELMGKLIGE